MKLCVIWTIIIGYLCLIVTGTTDGSFNNSTNIEESFGNKTNIELFSNTTLEESLWNSTSFNQSEMNTKVEYGVKSKVKGVYNKVKNKVKEIGTKVKNKINDFGKDFNKGNIGSGKVTNNWRHRYKYKDSSSSSSSYDTSTVIWIIIGITGGCVLIIAMIIFMYRGLS